MSKYDLGFGIYNVLKMEKNYDEAYKYLEKSNVASVRSAGEFNILDVKDRYFDVLEKYKK